MKATWFWCDVHGDYAIKPLCPQCEFYASEIAKTAENVKTAEQELQRWRGWAQFVYLGGGPVTLSDDELRVAVCAAHDQQVQEVMLVWRAFHGSTP